MDNKKTMGIIGVTVLVLVAIVAVSITYAAFTQDLTINGSATAKASSWKIKFKDLQPVEKTGTATEVTAPEIDNEDTNIGTFNVNFKTPGDSVTYKFKVANEGTFDAEVGSKTVGQVTCHGSGEGASNDETNVCDNIEYTITKADGSEINPGDELAHSTEEELKLTLTYKDTITEDKLPKDSVTVNIGQSTIIYNQKTA